MHEAFFVHVEQGAAVAPAALGDEDFAWHYAGWVELHGLHVAHGHHAGVEGGDVPPAIADDRVGGAGVKPPETPGGDDRGLGQVHVQLPRAKAARHRAKAGLAVVDEGDGLGLVVHLHAKLGADIVDGEQHAVAGAV